ncbi:MAG TPA: long-chain fatty acid--CoA ligase [Spirochaetota bacterium]
MILEHKPKKYWGSNIVDTFVLQSDRLGERTLVRYRENGIYVTKSWNEMREIVDNVASYFISTGVRKGDRIAIFAFNCWQWWAADMAALSVGAVTVPLYATNSVEETRFVLDHSTSRICFVGNEDQRDKVRASKKKLPALEKIVTFYDAPKKGEMLSFTTAIDAGRKAKKIKEVTARRKGLKHKDLLSIVYTSGTTGNPKGVMLSHGNIFSNVVQLLDTFGPYVNEDDTFLSFLPLSHVLERVAGYYAPIRIGCSVAFAEHFRTIQRDMQEIQPTVIVSVPRLCEKIHAGVLSTFATFSPVKRAIVRWALRVGRQNIPNVCANRTATGFLAKKLGFCDANVFSLLRKEIGFSRVRVAISGGGPLSYADGEFFLSIGINMFEGYGLTEASPVTNVNAVGCIRQGTVGPAMSNTTIAISDEGEVLVKGPQVMSGYYKDKAATKNAFDKKGYLRTGDLGRLDEDGNLTITGRIKDIIVTAGGKNISPQNIELALKQCRFIEHVAVIGDRRKFLSALIIPEFSEIEKWAKRQGIVFVNRAEMAKSPDVRALFSAQIEKVMKDFARVEQVKSFAVLDDIWGIDTGELTPSLKVKRRVIEEKYAQLIDSLYRDNG